MKPKTERDAKIMNSTKIMLEKLKEIEKNSNEGFICSQLIEMLEKEVAIHDIYINISDLYGDSYALERQEIEDINFWPSDWELTETPELSEFQPASEWISENYNRDSIERIEGFATIAANSAIAVSGDLPCYDCEGKNLLPTEPMDGDIDFLKCELDCDPTVYERWIFDIKYEEIMLEAGAGINRDGYDD